MIHLSLSGPAGVNDNALSKNDLKQEPDRRMHNILSDYIERIISAACRLAALHGLTTVKRGGCHGFCENKKRAG
jgi:hypothetical protein